MSLKETPRTEKRNVVLIHLESTRARSVTPYNEDLNTTPFLDELAKSSLLAERAYTTVPRTSKAIVSVNCGIQPHLVEEITEGRQGGIPSRGLADLLKEQRYSTAFFQSSTENFENFRDLVANFGYAEYYPLESFDEEYKEGFEWANYFGYEDDILLKPSEEWLKKHRDQPFMVKYLTGTGHHDYQTPRRYGLEDFSEDEELNRYLNCLRYQDFFVRNLIEQYKELGYYEETIFVVYGDHGEGFGEHGRWRHEDVIWEEGARVPLLIHAPGGSGGREGKGTLQPHRRPAHGARHVGLQGGGGRLGVPGLLATGSGNGRAYPVHKLLPRRGEGHRKPQGPGEVHLPLRGPARGVIRLLRRPLGGAQHSARARRAGDKGAAQRPRGVAGEGQRHLRGEDRSRLEHPGGNRPRIVAEQPPPSGMLGERMLGERSLEDGLPYSPSCGLH
jgi:hypothetical protein